MGHIKKWNAIHESPCAGFGSYAMLDQQVWRIQNTLSILKDAMIELSDKYEVSYNHNLYRNGYGIFISVKLDQYTSKVDVYFATQILDISLPPK